MVGSKAEKDHRRRVGKNWVIIGFWKKRIKKIIVCNSYWLFPINVNLFTLIKHQTDKKRLQEFTHIKILHWFSNIKLIHRGDYNGWSGEEEEEEEEDTVDQKAAEPPLDSSYWQMLPVGKGLHSGLGLQLWTQLPARYQHVLLPVNILRVGGIRDGPIVRFQVFAEAGAFGLPAAVAALTLASVEVL